MIASSLRDADDIVDLLLNKEADVNAKSKPCITQKPLHLFFFPLPLLLLKPPFSYQKRQPNHLSHPDFSGQTALHFTASKNNLETARKLISHKASARVKDKRGQLPLHRAAAIGSVPMVNLLLENKSPLSATDVSGLTALHHGRLFVFSIYVCIILRRARANVGTAISEGHGDTAIVLLKAGAETDKRDVDGNLAIDLAPDKKVGLTTGVSHIILKVNTYKPQIRQFILQSAEREGLELS